MIETNKCPICEKTELEEYEICDVCGWENDLHQYDNHDISGANHMSVNQAREAFAKGEPVL